MPSTLPQTQIHQLEYSSIIFYYPSQCLLASLRRLRLLAPVCFHNRLRPLAFIGEVTDRVFIDTDRSTGLATQSTESRLVNVGWAGRCSSAGLED